MKKTLPTTLLLIPTVCLAKDRCMLNNENYDVYAAAKTHRDAFAKFLPVQKSKNIRIEKAYSIQNAIVIESVFSYTQDYLEQGLVTNDISMEDMEEMMRNTVTKEVCKETSPLISFIKLGGEMKQLYYFADYAPYMSIEIKECP